MPQNSTTGSWLYNLKSYHSLLIKLSLPGKKFEKKNLRENTNCHLQQEVVITFIFVWSNHHSKLWPMQTAKILSVEILYEQEMLVESDNSGKMYL